MLQNIDFAVLDWIQCNLRCGFLDAIMPRLTLLGEKGLLWIALAVVFLIVRSRRKCGITLSVGLTGSLLIGNLLLKNIVMRARPCWINDSVQLLIAMPDDYSFPSGHTMSCFIAATILMYYDKRFGIPALVIAATVSFSRLYLYVHFPSDVLAGSVLGIAIGIGAIALCNLIFKRLQQRKNQNECVTDS